MTPSGGPATVDEPGRGTVTGLVIEAALSDIVVQEEARVDRRPLAHQDVTIRDTANQVVSSVTTSPAGRFRAKLEPGRYTVVFVRHRADGVEKRHQASVEIVAGRSIEVRLVDRVCYCG